MSTDSSRRPQLFSKCGTHISQGCQAYFDVWQEWLPVMAVAAAIAIASHLCCFLPFLFVAGPLGCGLFYCGLSTVRKQAVTVQTLQRGWERVRPSMLAGVLLAVLQGLPAFFLWIMMISWMLVFRSFEPHIPRQPRPDLQLMNRVEEGQDRPFNFDIPVDFPVDERQPAENGANRAQIPYWLIPVHIAFMGFIMSGVFASMAWWLWISTRTVFVLPLIADRGLDFGEAWRQSWEASRHNFWDLMITVLLAALLSSIGSYVCYIGLIVSLPMYYTIVAVAYEDRFPAAGTGEITP